MVTGWRYRSRVAKELSHYPYSDCYHSKTWSLSWSPRRKNATLAATESLRYYGWQLPKNFIVPQTTQWAILNITSVLPAHLPLHATALLSQLQVILQHINPTTECNHMLSYITTNPHNNWSWVVLLMHITGFMMLLF